jgi:hypothetical protein
VIDSGSNYNIGPSTLLSNKTPKLMELLGFNGAETMVKEEGELNVTFADAHDPDITMELTVKMLACDESNSTIFSAVQFVDSGADIFLTRKGGGSYIDFGDVGGPKIHLGANFEPIVKYIKPGKEAEEGGWTTVKGKGKGKGAQWAPHARTKRTKLGKQRYASRQETARHLN